MSEEIKKCPFCGGLASESVGKLDNGNDWIYIECEDCGGSSETRMWNKRPLEAQLAAEREARRWISVAERLPEPEDETVVLVIILMDNGKTGVDMAYFRHGKFLTFAGTPVTHWQYLPQPPDGDA